MFEQFLKFVQIDTPKSITNEQDFIDTFEGFSFLDGLYRLFYKKDVEKWNEIVGKSFPPAFGMIQVFGYDWAGIVFAIFKRTNTVIVLEPGTGEVYDTELSFAEFHDKEIPQKHRMCLMSDFFKKWRAKDASPIKHEDCVGYIVPLFLNGKDVVDNLEVSDMEVYWEIMMPLINL